MKGVDTIIASVLILVISITAIFLALQLGGPSTQKAKEVLLMQEGKNSLVSIDDAVKNVLAEGEGSTRVLRLSVAGGEYKIDNTTNSVLFSMDSRGQVIAEGVSKIENGINFSGSGGMVYLNLSYDNIQITGEGEFGRGYHTLTIRNNGYNTTTQRQMIYISLAPIAPPSLITFIDQYNQSQTLVLYGTNTTSPDYLNDLGINAYNITEGLEVGGQHNFFQGNTENLTGFNTTSADYTNSLDGQNYNVTSTSGQTGGTFFNQYNQSQTLVLIGANTTSPDNLNKIDGLTYNVIEAATVKTRTDTSSDLQSGAIQNKLTSTQNWYLLMLNESNRGNLGDTYTNQSASTTNYGTLTTMIVRSYSSSRNARIWTLWNLTAIPSDAVIANANLSLYRSSTVSRTYNAYNTTNAWTETGLTWSNQPAENILQDTEALGTSAGWKYWNVTNAAINQFNQANKNLSIEIRDNAEGSGTSRINTFYTKEYATVSQRPRLNVTYFVWTSQEDANTSYTQYSDIPVSNLYSTLTNVTVILNISSYNNTASAGRSSNPDLWLEIWNSTSWLEIGIMNVDSAGIFSLSTQNPTILSSWTTQSNRDIRIKGRYFDVNRTAWDEINYTDVWVSIDSRETAYRAEVEHNSTVSYSENLNSMNISVNFSTNVTSTFNLTVYDFDSGSWDYAACQDGVANAGSWYNWWCNITSNPSFYNSSDGKIRVRLNETDHSGVAIVREEYVQYYLGHAEEPTYANISIEHNSSAISEDILSITKINVTAVLKTNVSSAVPFNFYIYNFSSSSWHPCSQASINTNYLKMECIIANNPSDCIYNNIIRIRLNSSGGTTTHQMMEDYLTYQITMTDSYRMEVEHNSTVSYAGTLNNISVSLNFSTNATNSPTFNLTIYNFISGNWEICDTFNPLSNMWYTGWCNKTINPENYLSNNVIRVRLNDSAHQTLAEVKEDYIQYYVTHTQ